MGKKAIFEEVDHVLHQLIQVISSIEEHEYTLPISILSNSSIGEHTRHIIELFEQLINSYSTLVLNYDARERKYILQNDLKSAISAIYFIIENIEKPNKTIGLISSYNNEEEIIETNYYREIMYNIEHCIHHQAIIKNGLLSINKECSIDNFGVAKSTINFKNQCVQ